VVSKDMKFKMKVICIFCNVIETCCLKRKAVGIEMGEPFKPFIIHMLLAHAFEKLLICLCKRLRISIEHNYPTLIIQLFNTNCLVKP
jgi:hypothetical protein